VLGELTTSPRRRVIFTGFTYVACVRGPIAAIDRACAHSVLAPGPTVCAVHRDTRPGSVVPVINVSGADAGGALRIVIALDSFKGSVTSAQACAAVRIAVLRAVPDAVVTVIPVADGGEGTLDALAWLGVADEVETVDLLGRPLLAAYLTLGDSTVIESATTLGLGLLGEPSPATARAAHSYGLGLQMVHILTREAPTRLLVGLGGTGCTDGGTGLLLALGARMWDASGTELFAGGMVPGSNPLLALPVRVELPAALPCEVIGLADVTSPLLGPSGAARMFGPQKGADAALVERLEPAMEDWATALRAEGADVADVPGAGAAGGLGAALLALGGSVEPGLERIVAETGAGEALAGADLVFTGEGSLDAQTGMGKVPDAIARLAKAGARSGTDGARIPLVIALAGIVEGDSHGAIDAAYCIHSRPRPLAEAMDPAVTLAELSATAERAVREWMVAAKNCDSQGD